MFLRNLYRGATRVALPFALLYERLAYSLSARELRQRLAFLPQSEIGHRRTLWIHGSSVGEVRSGTAVGDTVAREGIGEFSRIVMTAFSVPASRVLAREVDVLRKKWPHLTVNSQLLPFDTSTSAAAFLKYHQPHAALFVESDIWPEYILELSRRGVPAALIDGRMGPRSFDRWSRFAPVAAKEVFSSLRYISAQTSLDAIRLGSLVRRKVPVRPSLKYYNMDGYPGRSSSMLDAGVRPIWVAASTHTGEEEVVLEAFRKLQGVDGLKNALLVVAPRHPQRSAAVSSLFPKAVLLSDLANGFVPREAAVVIVDTLGDLPQILRCADAAFIGNSLPSSGQGHNFCEAARFGVPCTHGPNFGRYTSLKESLVEAAPNLSGTIQQISTSEDLASTTARSLLHRKHDSRARDKLKEEVEQHGAGARDHIREAIKQLV